AVGWPADAPNQREVAPHRIDLIATTERSIEAIGCDVWLVRQTHRPARCRTERGISGKGECRPTVAGENNAVGASGRSRRAPGEADVHHIEIPASAYRGERVAYIWEGKRGRGRRRLKRYPTVGGYAGGGKVADDDHSQS